MGCTCDRAARGRVPAGRAGVKGVVVMAVVWLLQAGCSTFGPPSGPQPRAASAVGPADPEAEAVSEVLAGEIAGQSGDLEEALRHYLRAAELSDDPRLAARATRIAVYAGNPDEAALRAARRWLELEPDSVEARQTLALLHVRQGRPEEAVEHLDAVVRLLGDGKGHGYLAVAASLAKEKDSAAALEAMERLVARHEREPAAWYALGFLALEAGDADRALEAAGRALALDPGHVQARVLRADAYLAQGRVDDAVASMREAVEVSPRSFDLRLRLGRLLVRAERYAQARAVFEALLRERPADPTLVYTLGLLNLQARDLDAARRYFRQLAEAAGDRRHEAWFYLGQIAEEQGRTREALRWYRRIEPGEYFIESRGRMADLLATRGRLEEARAVLARARARVSSAAEGVRLYLMEGQLLREAEKYREGVELYNRALTEYPGNEDLLYARAIMAEALGRVDWTERDLKAILEADPDNAAALNALGYTLADHNLRLEEALGYIRRAMELTPDDPAVIDSMGWVQYRLGNLEEAERYLRRAYAALKDAEIAGHLAEVLWKRGKREEARRILHEALKAHPEDRYLKTLAERISG